MFTEPLPGWLVNAVIGIALLGGIGSVGNANWVWLKKHLFGAAGFSLCGTGVILIGLSVWGNVKIKAAGWELNLERISALVSENPQVAQAIIEEALVAHPQFAGQLAARVVDRSPEAAIRAVEMALEVDNAFALLAAKQALMADDAWRSEIITEIVRNDSAFRDRILADDAETRAFEWYSRAFVIDPEAIPDEDRERIQRLLRFRIHEKSDSLAAIATVP